LFAVRQPVPRAVRFEKVNLRWIQAGEKLKNLHRILGNIDDSEYAAKCPSPRVGEKVTDPAHGNIE